MRNFIYSVQEIFTKCLDDNTAQYYYIGPYQRGYKWKSGAIHDQVPVLLLDLFEAFEKNKEKSSDAEYYLQYITVKRSVKGSDAVLEVIDGQQRLTSLTLFFNVLQWFFSEDNIAKNERGYKVQYSRYGNISENIFDQIFGFVQDENTVFDSLPHQDKYYMCLATQAINRFFTILSNEDSENFNAFINYVKNNVKIILNTEDEFSSAEEVFSSLNANKVPLTNAYLIKGLLLTKASRVVTNGFQKGFKEILNERNLLAKTWDEMQNWFSEEEVSMYFFSSKENGMESALKLVRLTDKSTSSSVLVKFKETFGYQDISVDDKYELFNRFHENVLTAEDALFYLSEVKHLYLRLSSWYKENRMYNLLGYFLKTGGKISDLTNKKNIELDTELKAHLRSQIDFTEEDLKILKYGKPKQNEKIKKMLLAFSVFPENKKVSCSTDYRFNFFSYSEEGWTLEHIFPQNPGESCLDITDDRDWIMRKCEEKGFSALATKIEMGQEVTGEELSFIFEEFPEPDILGNMALLSAGVNSALSNGMFNTKRKILLKKISSGSFVPKHTIEVFSKMLPEHLDGHSKMQRFDADLMMWTVQDAKAHSAWISNRIKNMKEQL